MYNILNKQNAKQNKNNMFKKTHIPIIDIRA